MPEKDTYSALKDYLYQEDPDSTVSSSQGNLVAGSQVGADGDLLPYAIIQAQDDQDTQIDVDGVEVKGSAGISVRNNQNSSITIRNSSFKS